MRQFNSPEKKIGTKCKGDQDVTGTHVFTWGSDNPDIASVSETGLVRAESSGETNIHVIVKYGSLDLQGLATVTVGSQEDADIVFVISTTMAVWCNFYDDGCDYYTGLRLPDHASSFYQKMDTVIDAFTARAQILIYIQ